MFGFLEDRPIRLLARDQVDKRAWSSPPINCALDVRGVGPAPAITSSCCRRVFCSVCTSERYRHFRCRADLVRRNWVCVVVRSSGSARTCARRPVTMRRCAISLAEIEIVEIVKSSSIASACWRARGKAVPRSRPAPYSSGRRVVEKYLSLRFVTGKYGPDAILRHTFGFLRKDSVVAGWSMCNWLRGRALSYPFALPDLCVNVTPGHHDVNVRYPSDPM